MQLLTTCLTTFQDVQHERSDWYKYDEPHQGLAFNLNEIPTEDQMWGYYARLQHLPSHFMRTWEEMMTTAFCDPTPLLSNQATASSKVCRPTTYPALGYRHPLFFAEGSPGQKQRNLGSHVPKLPGFTKSCSRTSKTRKGGMIGHDQVLATHDM